MIVKRQPLKDGTTLMLGDKKCRILQKIGQGSSCIVYKAKLNKRNVILKELYPKNRDIVRGLDDSLIIPRNSFEVFEEDKRRFSRSFDLQTEFHNYEELTNYTSDIEDIYNLNNTYYAVIGIVTGNSYDNIQPENLLSVLKVGNSLAKAISYYHQRGYLHLDIKPENIFNLPETDELVQLFDFDTVATREEVLKGQFSYSEGYVAKEVKDAKESDGRFSEIDERADIFSIGVVIFEKIMGRRPDSSDHRKGKKWNFSLNPYLKDTVPQLQTGMTELFRKTIARDKNNRYSSAEELIKDLGKLIELASIKVFLKSQNISPCTAKNIYIPRKSVCDSIYNRLNQYHILYIYTIRGNGKSETAREYAETYANNYNFIQSIFYSQNLKNTIANLDFVGLKQEDKIAHTDEDIDRLYSYKLDFLGNTDIYTSNTLLIIDNYDYDSNPESEEYKQNVKVLADLRKLHIHIIFTTRINPTDKAHCFKLPNMFQEELEELFFKINPVQKDDPDRKRLVDEIIEVSYNHTMTVKLVALQSKKYKKSLEEYLSVLKENGLNSHIQGRITNEKDDESITMSAVYDHIKALFDFDNLSDKEKYIMVNACLLPLEGLDTVTFSNFIDLDNFDGSSSDCIDESIEDLANSGWINYADNDETKICLHPLIGDIVKNELKPELTEDKCRKFYISFLDLISDWGNKKTTNIDCFYQKKVIYSLFPKIDTIFENKCQVLNEIEKNQQVAKAINYILFCPTKLDIKNYMIVSNNELALYFGNEEKITIPYNVNKIKNSAFSKCFSLKEIIIPDSVTEIGMCAFNSCVSLKEITISDSITKIEMSAFQGCTSLKEIVIPNSITKIESFTFSGCISLEKVTIPDSITEIEGMAFCGCFSLKSVIISESITKIGAAAFSGCTSLEKITIPNGLTEIEAGTFEGCVYLKKIILPKGLTKIGICAFHLCIALETINIPDSVTEIETMAFNGCVSLKEITIPNGVIEIDMTVFAGCTSLKKINVSPKINILRNCYSLSDCLEKFTIPKHFKKILPGTFMNHTRLKEIVISDSVTKIGFAAFQGCTSLEKITIPDSVTEIENSAFQGCISLKKIIIPDSVTEIEVSVFQECTSLKEITIPDGVNKIRMSAFQDCTSLEKITIPDTVNEIEMLAFQGCKSLKKITIPENLTEIKSAVFEDCTFLKEIIIPKKIVYIYSGAFSYNTLEKITFLGHKTDISKSLIGYYENKYGLEIKNENLIIVGYKGSTAEEYAKEHGFNFIALD